MVSFKVQPAALNAALDVVKIVEPRPFTPQGASGFLFVVRKDADGKDLCFIYSRDETRMARAHCEISDVQGEGAFILPGSIDSFKFVENPITFTADCVGKASRGRSRARRSVWPPISFRFPRLPWNGEEWFMEAKELRDLTIDDLKQKSTELREEIGHLKLKRATSRLENPMKLGETKRDLARVETVLRQKALAGEKGAA